MAVSTAETRFDWSGTRGAEFGGPVMESAAFRDDAYEFIDSLIEFSRRRGDMPAWYHSPIDVLEAARMELMLQMRPAVRDWQAWQRLKNVPAQSVVLEVPEQRRTEIERDLATMRLPQAVRVRSESSQPPSRLQQGKRAGWIATRDAAFRFVDWLETRGLPRRPFPLGLPNRTRVMFADYHSNSVHVLIPLWRRFAASTDFQCLYLAGREKVRKELSRSGIASINLRRSEPAVTAADVTPPQWNQLLAAFFDDLARRTGCEVAPSIRLAFEAAAGLIGGVRQTALRMQRAFEQFRPEYFFVSSGAHSPARAGELLCRRFDCVGVHLQHGLFLGDRQMRGILSETVCVWGDVHRRLMNENPCPGVVAVTGSPKHDELRRKFVDRPRSPQPLVAFYSSRRASWMIGSDDFDRHIDAVFQAARDMADVQFVVKLHPAEHREAVGVMNADPRKPANLQVTQTDDSYDLLQRCHVCMTVSSTIGHESLLFRKPLVILNLTGRPCAMPLADVCTPYHVEQASDLAATLRTALQSPGASDAAAADFWMNDGRSIERIWAHAQSLRQTHPSHRPTPTTPI